MSCLILGDSIALGLAAALGVNGTVCTVAARVGATSVELPRQIAQARPQGGNVILSVGTNDAPRVDLEANLAGARMALGRARVTWLLPYRRRSAYAVTRIAFRFGDAVIDLAALPSRDHIHPASYNALAATVLR